MSEAPQESTEANESTSDQAPSKDDCTMAMLAHLLGIFTGFLGPLIIWLVKKDSSAFVDDQGKESLNFQLTLLIVYVAASILTCITFGLGGVLVPLIWVVGLIFMIMAAVAANKGETYRYPVSLRLIK